MLSPKSFAGPIYSSGGGTVPAKLGRWMRGWHGFAANTILIVGGMHAAAALFHHYLLRDDVLRRMLPR
jgi:cytochrome b561